MNLPCTDEAKRETKVRGVNSSRIDSKVVSYCQRSMERDCHT